MYGMSGIGRVTRWFEMHPQWFFLRNPLRDHAEWLREDHDFPIYMLQEFDIVPSSVRYPLKEIQDKLLVRLERDDGNIKKLFSSTMCYMLALALYEGFERIELFGIELLMTDEWAYQREALAFWLGRAEGMGVEVWMPKSCSLFQIPLYGYDQLRLAGGGVFSADQQSGSNPITIRGIHEGQTAIVIGNGPSLNTVPKEFLEKYPTFGVNHINLLPFQPTYHVVVDAHLLRNLADRVYDVAAGARITFLGAQSLTSAIPAAQRLYALPNAFILGPGQFEFPGETVWTGWTSVYVALKIAYTMGFKTVLLVGVDHALDHFTQDYPVSLNAVVEGSKRLAGHREHFALANEVYKAAGRRIVNLSPPSVLDKILERGNIKDWL